MTLKAKIHNRFAFCVNFLRPLHRKKKSARKRLVSGRSADSVWLHGCGGWLCILHFTKCRAADQTSCSSLRLAALR